MSIGLGLINVGTVAGDDSGTKGRICFQTMNANSALIEAAIEDAELKAFVVKCVGKDTVIAVEDSVEWWRQPYAFVLTEVRAAVYAEQSGDDIVIDITEDGVSVLDSNLLVIPAGSDTSVGFSPAALPNNIILQDNSKMEIDIVEVGSGATATGLEVTLIGYVIWVTD